MLKFLKISFFALILTTLFSSGLFFPAKGVKASDMKYEFQVPISTENSVTFDGSTEPIGLYIQGIYKYAIGVVAVIATVIMMFGGFLWIVAGGNAEQIGNAKAWIGASLSGLVLVMLSYTILSFINPELVNFKKQTIKKIQSKPSLCCIEETGNIARKNEDGTCPPATISCNDYCKDKDVAEECAANGFCYNGVCETEDGLEGDVCGITPDSYCYDGNVISDFCPTDYVDASFGASLIEIGGRDCADGLYCCRPK